jgi:hypothetical protein
MKSGSTESPSRLQDTAMTREQRVPHVGGKFEWGNYGAKFWTIFKVCQSW